MRRFDAAEVVTLSAAGVALAGDVWLVARQRATPDTPCRLVTDVLRTPAGTFALVYLLLHVVDVLGPFDLFRLALRLSGRLTRKALS